MNRRLWRFFSNKSHASWQSGINFDHECARECGTTRRDWYPSRDRKNDSRKLEVAFSFERVRFVYSDNMSQAPAQASANDPADFKNEDNVKRFVRPNRWLALDLAGVPVRFDTRARAARCVTICFRDGKRMACEETQLRETTSASSRRAGRSKIN